ncbi:hypothetical protein [Deltalipothrixvirus pozzuoliense]|uniref:Uncharacterized protein ORF107 n=1 Tax=Acidianus filamentous virus 2 (isolate Italy/Pozzuoli) TaxID=654910 RepID=Y107_AFV2P|nr:hypothetical protein AFV2_gp24 [Acidianus filamentous virus 2]Q573E5.1 RecName: Full=Uncharacterized protein ORF107 [Acidianus filamentous virus 2 (isolate Pozzuoli)]CAH69411.1 hypothetical protein [Acidianus filamentous virus 2]
MFRRGNNDEIKSTIRSIINPSGIIKYNVVYIPKYDAYRITLVSSTGNINASYIAEIISQLTAQGYAVMMKTPRSTLLRGGVVVLYAEKHHSNVGNDELPPPPLRKNW